MRVEFPFADEILDFDLASDSLVGAWLGPGSRPAADLGSMITRALDSPLEFPPLTRAIVPGDQVAIAWDSQTPQPLVVLAAILKTLGEAGVEPETIRVITTSAGGVALGSERPQGARLTIHDSADVSSTAYLATTTNGRRIYLNRQLIDADVVLSVGRLGFDPGFGHRGPWSALYPSLTSAESLGTATPSLEEVSEVSWLLGSPFQIGLLQGASGVIEVVAGLDSAVRAEGIKRTLAAWRFPVDRRSDLVVAGLGPSSGIEELALGLESACGLVARGGKIVVLSHVEGPLGRTCRRLLGLDDPRSALNRIKGLEKEPDHGAAKRIAQALAWADVYLYSRLGDQADDLVTASLGRASEARRLVATADSVVFLAFAERTRAEVVGEGSSR